MPVLPFGSGGGRGPGSRSPYSHDRIVDLDSGRYK